MPRTSRLDSLIEQATVDCYNDSERAGGFFEALTEALEMPFTTTVVGVPVVVRRLSLTDEDRVVAVCSRAGLTQSIPLTELRLPDPPPVGAEWAAAYRLWALRCGRAA